MKRSEMILDLASELVTASCDCGINPLPFDKAQDIAEKLLNRIEETGMLPPSEGIDMFLIEYWRKDKYEQYIRLDEVQKYIMSHTWDPEASLSEKGD